VSGETAGQQAYEARYAAMAARLGQDEFSWEWDEVDPGNRADWEAAAAAVETDQVRLAREDRDQLRKRVLDLAAELEDEAASLSATGVTRGNRLRHETAAKLRHAAEPPS
jgi:hypothetical protein